MVLGGGAVSYERGTPVLGLLARQKGSTHTVPGGVLCPCQWPNRRTLGRCAPVFASNLCSMQFQQCQCTCICVFRATWKGKHSPMITHTCTTTAEISGRDVRTQTMYPKNTCSIRFLRSRDVLESTKLAGGREGLMDLMLDAVYHPTTPVDPL